MIIYVLSSSATRQPATTQAAINSPVPVLIANTDRATSASTTPANAPKNPPDPAITPANATPMRIILERAIRRVIPSFPSSEDYCTFLYAHTENRKLSWTIVDELGRIFDLVFAF